MADQPPEQRVVVDRFRVVVRRHGQRSHRWQWALERESYDERWELSKEGHAWTLEGARVKAMRAIYKHEGIDRWEMLIAYSTSYTPRERKPSPLVPRLVTNAPHTGETP